MTETKRHRSEGHRRLCTLLKDYSQAELAKTCGLSRATISDLVASKKDAGLETANALAKHYGIGQQLWSEPAREAE